MFGKLLGNSINMKNFVDYYGRLSVPVDSIPIAALAEGLQMTFKNDKVYKISLRNIDLEKLNKTYLLFKGDLEPGERKFTFMFFDEFIKNVPVKSSYKIFSDLEQNFFNPSCYRFKFLLTSIIVIEEFLTYDEKFVNVYCNKPCMRHLTKMIKINTVKWFKPSDDKILQAIKRMGRKTKTDWEEEQQNNPTNNYNQNWEDLTLIEDFLPLDTVDDNIKYRYTLDRLI